MINSNDKGLKFMKRGHMRRVAPSIFTEKASEEVSKHYTHIPTTKVINDMESLGWGVVECKEVKARKNSTKGFQKHLVIFRNPDVVIHGENNDTVYPQILLTNSHDGKNAFQFTAGLFRMICENGLIVETETFESVKMRHMGYTFSELQENIRGMVEQLPLTVESMNKMKETELSQEVALDFAKNALLARFTEKEMKRIKIDITQLLQPVRSEDKGKDLWSIFNVVQERVIDGDFEYRAAGKARKARKIKNFKQDLKVNSKLFTLALDYVS
jgi:hypothetical protein